MLSLLKLFLSLSAVAGPPMASYPSALPNRDLCVSIAEDTERKIFRNDWFCGSVDGSVFMRSLGPAEFYHGFSYWIQGRTQFEPGEFFRVNVRTIFYSGSISYGYTLPTGFYNLIGFSGKWPSLILGGEFHGRAMDLERQTIAAGLFIEEFESAGVRFDWRWENWNVKLLGEGTGALVLDDDTINVEIAYGPRATWLGFGGIWWTEKQIRRKPLQYVYSIVDWTDWFQTKAEAALRNGKYAYLLATGFRFQSNAWNFESLAQGRLYQDEVGDEFVGQIRQLYTAYDQLDKHYTNAKNIFVVGDDVLVYSLKLNITYQPSDHWHVFSLNEVGNFEYRRLESNRFWFAKAGLTYFPVANRKDSLTFFFSNKILMDSLALPPNRISQSNVPAFTREDYGGIEGNFRF